jgi:hypothetical protein
MAVKAAKRPPADTEGGPALTFVFWLSPPVPTLTRVVLPSSRSRTYASVTVPVGRSPGTSSPL